MSLTVQHRKHIKTNNPLPAYAKHILNNQHKYGKPRTYFTTTTTMSKSKTYELLAIFIHTDTAARTFTD